MNSGLAGCRSTQSPTSRCTPTPHRFGGFNKVSVVTGPFLIVASVFSVLRQTGRISVDHEIPILVIVLGILMLISQLSRLPVPDLFKDENHE